VDALSPLLVWAFAAALVVVGVVGTVMPALPGALLVFAGLFLMAWIDGFAHVGTGTLVLLGVLTAGVYMGASPRAIVGAALGALVGLFFGLPGILLGPFVGAVVAEYTVRRDLEHASRVGIGTWIGMVFGAAVKLALIFTMLGVFALARFL
jgi:hypothetical protein